MGKEVKIGLALIGALLITFGVVLYRRLVQGNLPPAAAPGASQGMLDSAPSNPSLEKPTVVTAASDAATSDPAAGQEDGGRYRDRFARQAASTEADRAEPPRSFMPDAADVSTAGRYSTPQEPAADPASREALLTEPQTDPPAASDPNGPAGGANGPAGDRFQTPTPAALNPGDESAGGGGALPQRGRRNYEDNAGETSANRDASAARTASRDYAPEDRGGYIAQNDPAAAPRTAPSYAAPAAEAAALAGHYDRPGSFARGQGEPDDPIAEQQARFTAGARAVPGRTGAPTAAEPGKYVVQPNDNYWIISEKVYGMGGFFKALHEHNKAEHPRAERMQVGDVISVPPVAVLHREYPALCPKPGHVRVASQTQAVAAGPRQRPGAKVYVVEQGDTLFDIARYKLGKASRWAEIYEINRDALGDDFHYLRPGTELVMPGGDRDEGDAMTRQRDNTLQR